MLPHWAIWLIVAIVCAAAEIMTLTFFISWFGVGALVAALVSLFGASLPVQFCLFLLVSLILVISTKKVTAKWIRKDREVKTNIYGLEGKTGYVTEEIVEGGSGQVKVNGEVWTAVSESGKKVPCGARVRVVRVEGVHLVVQAVD